MRPTRAARAKALVGLGDLTRHAGALASSPRPGRHAFCRFRKLIADAGHALSDVMVSVGVTISLVIVRLGWEQADGIAALLVAVVIFRTAWGILRGVLHALGDAARLPADEVAVAACVVPDVVSCHGVRSRDARSHVYVDLHVQVAPGTTVERGHEIAHEVEASLRRA